jgi:hypothetical protein
MQDIKAGVELLAKIYCKKLRPELLNKSEELDKIKEFIEVLRKEGFSGKEIAGKIDKFHEANIKINIEQLFTQQERIEKRYTKNLLEPGQIYLHNQIKIPPENPKATFDPETGEYIFEDIDQTVRFVNSYTILDLLNFFYSKCNITRRYPERDKGAMYYLLSLATLDEILFTISFLEENEHEVQDAISLRDYLNDGILARKRAYELMLEYAIERGGFEWFPLEDQS